VLAAAALVSIAAISVVGCGGAGLTASSSCADFSKASPEEQTEAVSTLSSEFDTPEYTTPLGEPEVGYYCAGNADTTLEAFFNQAQQYGE
jgi:hypothetical protein